MTCGCGVPDAKHDPDAIDWSDLEAAASDAGVTPEQAAANIVTGVHQMMTKARVVEKSEANRFLLMVGYSPNRLPLRGADGFLDVASPEVIEKACWRFMANGAGAGLMHKSGGEDAFRVVENSIYRGPDWTLTATDGSTQTVRKGEWLIGVICSPATWDDYKKGVYGSGSLQGNAVRIPARPETLASQRSE
jgi:hypothetical protein